MAADPSGSRRGLRWLFAIQLLSMGPMEMSTPFWPLHLRTLGQLSPQALAWASSAAYAGPMLMALCFTPWWGRLGDRIGHKPMVLRALVALAAMQLVVAFADSVAIVLAARLAQGALGGFIAAAQAYGAGLVDRQKRGRLMAQLQVATAAGSALGPLLGGLIFESWGFRTVNAVAALACLLCGVAAAAALPASLPSKPSAMARTANTLSRGAVAGWHALSGLLLGITLVQTGKMMPQAFFGLFTEEVLGASPALSGLCYGAAALGLCVAAPLWGKWFESKSREEVLRRVEWICWACAAIVAIQAISRDPAVFVATRLLWGICLGALLPVFYALLSRDAGERNQGAVLGAGNSAAKAGALLGTVMGGLMLGWLPIEHIFWPVAAIYAIAAIGLRLIQPTTSFPLIVEEKNET
jgi:MFS family permease